MWIQKDAQYCKWIIQEIMEHNTQGIKELSIFLLGQNFLNVCKRSKRALRLKISDFQSAQVDYFFLLWVSN